MTKTNLAQFNNKWYNPGAGVLKRTLWYFLNVLIMMNPLLPFSGFKLFFLRLFGAKIGKGVLVKPSVNIKYPWRLQIGNNVWIGEGVWIDNLEEVSIGDNVCISQGAFLLCGNHNYKKQSFDLEIGKIVLEEGVWIGAKSIVCPGITCASHSVLAAGSVATKNLAAFTIYQGNPAIKLRERIMNQ
jgi:putative colanic acid biosynthesis acetyltransferase WcaF